ncbi:MAG: LysR family transcriptional regulator [Elusimicrobia bacterium]|nr:LysR family transcriptional regulator [Elusimicrobiota bacterium]
MIPVNLHQLYYFWVIAKSGSITSATKCLFLNQSTLSKQLRQLETTLGKRLMVRTRYGVTLTGEGRLAFAYCDRVFPQVEELVALLRSDAAAHSPSVRLAVSRSIARDKVLSLTRFIKGLKGPVTVKVVSGSPDDLKQLFDRRAVDIVLADTDLSSVLGRDCRAKLVASIPHYFVASAKLKGQDFPGVLARVPLMLRSADNPLRKAADYFLRSNKIVPNIVAELDSPDLIFAMVLAGEGVGVLDPIGISDHLERGRVVKLHSRPIGIRENLWLLCSQQPCSSAQAQAVVDTLMTRFRLSPKR